MTLEELLERFPAGYYIFSSMSNEGDTLGDTALLTRNLPAAPNISGFEGAKNVPTSNAVISWAPGTDPACARSMN